MINNIKKVDEKNKMIIYLIIVLLFSFVSRVVIFTHVYHANPENSIFNDTPRYEAPALNLLHTGSLAINPHSINTPTLSTTPGYSLLIAGVYKIFGEKRYPLIIFQILISTLSIFIIFVIAAKLWTHQAALIASTLMAISPLQILYSQLMLSETLFTLFVVLSLLSATYLIIAGQYPVTKNYYYKWAFLLGLMIACSTMVRPISYYLVVCVVLGLVYFKKQLGYKWKQLANIILLIMLPAIILYGSWQVRNGMLTGVYEINDAKSETMLFWKAKGVLMTKYSLEEVEAEKKIMERLPPSFHSFKEKLAIEKKLGIEIITNNFDDYLKLTINNLIDIMLGIGVDTQAKYYSAKTKKENIIIAGHMSSIISHNNIIVTIEKATGYKVWYLLIMGYSGLLLLAIYYFSAYGFICSFNQSLTAKILNLLMLGIVAYFIILSTGHASAYSRMRVPVMPIFILYAAYGLYIFLKQYFYKASINKF
jgi:4-amino-4-deoxy-L-arabinose transferase-like glycosyltransferase